MGATGGAGFHGPEAVSKTAALSRNFRSYVRPSNAGRKWTTAPSGPRSTERERSGGAEVEGKKRNRQPQTGSCIPDRGGEVATSRRPEVKLRHGVGSHEQEVQPKNPSGSAVLKPGKAIVEGAKLEKNMNPRLQLHISLLARAQIGSKELNGAYGVLLRGTADTSG